MDLKIIRMNKVTGVGKVLAFVDVSFYGMEINGLKLVNGEKGKYISYPQDYKGKLDKFYNVVYPGDIIVKYEIEKYIIESYEKLNQINGIPLGD